MKTIMCFGTFDIIHLGHINYFEQAKEIAQNLVVVVATDATKEKQERQTIFDQQERLALVNSLEIVNRAVLGNKDDHFKVIEEIKPDIILLGYDHPIKEEQLHLELEKRNLSSTIKRAKAYNAHKHKSTKIKELLLKQH